MAVAKRQEREKPPKIEKRKVKGSLRTGVRTSGRTNSTPGWPNLHRAGQGEGKKPIKAGAKVLSLSPPHACTLSLFLPLPLPLSLPPPPLTHSPTPIPPPPRCRCAGTLLHSLLLACLGWHALNASRMDSPANF